MIIRILVTVIDPRYRFVSNETLLEMLSVRSGAGAFHLFDMKLSASTVYGENIAAL